MAVVANVGERDACFQRLCVIPSRKQEHSDSPQLEEARPAALSAM
jgi:hypothetical protein